MEETSSNNSSDSDEADDILFHYLKERCYITEAEEDSRVYEHTLPNVSINGREAEVLATARMDASDPGFITYTCNEPDIQVAEAQISALKSWLTERDDEIIQKEVNQIIMPLVCNLFLNCLRTGTWQRCVEFLMRHSCDSALTKSWRPVLDQLINVNSLADIDAYPLVKSFSSCKCEIRLSTRTLIVLRKFLIRWNCTLLLQVLKSRFKIDTVSDYHFISEEEVLFSSSVLKNSKKSDDGVNERRRRRRKRKENGEGESDGSADEELDELAAEVLRLRLGPTPPPPLLLYTAHKTDGVVCGSVCERGNLAATGDRRSEVRVWCLSDTKHNPSLHPSYFAGVPLLAPTVPINDVDAQNRKQWWSLRGHGDAVYDVAFSPDSEYLVSVSFDATMRLWNMHDFSCSAVYRGHTQPVWCVSMSPAHNMVVTGSSDRTARLWTLDRTYPIRVLAGHTLDVTCCAFHPNGSYVGTGGVDKSIRLWSVADGSLVRVMGRQRQQGFVHALSFSPDGQYVASAGGDSSVWIWSLADGDVAYRLKSNATGFTGVTWSTDGASVAAAASDGTLFLWHVDTLPSEPRKYSTACSTLLSVQYSSKNSLVAVGLD